MSEVIRNGLEGLQRGFEQAAVDSVRVTAAFTENSKEDPILPLSDLRHDEIVVKASAKVVQIGDSLTKTALNILA